ncbi:hypothetical protein [Paenibacillus taichungensis]|uniref:hypothetical protein n=1 Tax=Paenibacillus taichungensis TaxID=484184 RepID=UPI0039A17236
MNNETQWIVDKLKSTIKMSQERSSMEEIVVVVDLNSQIKEKFEIFKVIMGEGTVGFIDRNEAKLVNRGTRVRIITSSIIRGQRGKHVLDMSKKNDKEFLHLVRNVEIQKNPVNTEVKSVYQFGSTELDKPDHIKLEFNKIDGFTMVQISNEITNKSVGFGYIDQEDEVANTIQEGINQIKD